MSTIEIKNLTKRYGEAEVLSNINMKLESGKIYGLVGRNGSGKDYAYEAYPWVCKGNAGNNFDKWKSSRRK